MALRKVIQTEGKSSVYTSFGVIDSGLQRVVFDAYIKVISITGDKNKVKATVNFSNSEQNFNKQYLIPVSVATDAPNFIKQTYEHLKTLPEFAGATDC